MIRSVSLIYQEEYNKQSVAVGEVLEHRKRQTKKKGLKLCDYGVTGDESQITKSYKLELLTKMQ